MGAGATFLDDSFLARCAICCAGSGDFARAGAGPRTCVSGVLIGSGDFVLSRSAAGVMRLTLRCGYCKALRAAGLFFTGSTRAVLPLAPFHGSLGAGGWSRGSAETGGG